MLLVYKYFHSNHTIIIPSFGMTMNERCFSSPAYRYGFNKQEKDDEVAGSGNINTATFWEYDSRLGRRWNKDPDGRIEESPFACFGDNPILNTDVNGDFYITDHNDINRKANRIVYGKFWGAVRTFLSLPTTFLIETVLSWVKPEHLDSRTHEQMANILASGGYMKFNSHQLQDFYAHSNYVEILREYGYTPETMVTFDKLDPKSEVYKRVMRDIETTAYPDKGQRNGHNGKRAGGNKVLAGKENHDDQLTPQSCDVYMAKDPNGKHHFAKFNHLYHAVAIKLALEATISKKEGTTINNTEAKPK